MKLEKLYKKLEKKFNRYYKLSFHFNGNINTFTFSPYLGLKTNDHQEIIVKLISNKEDLEKYIGDLERKLELKTQTFK